MRPSQCTVVAGLGGAVLLLAAGAARAESTLRLSESEVVARALEQSPMVVRAAAERDVVASARVQAGIALPANPVVEGAGGHRSDSSRSVPLAAGPEWTVRLSQTVEIAGQRGARLREVDRSIAVAEAQQRLAQVETRANARDAYVTLQVARAQLDAAAKRVQLGDQLLQAAQARVKAGAASDVELHLAEVERARLDQERLDAELAVSDAERALKLLIAAPRDAHVEPTTPLETPAPLDADADRLVQQALAQREELRILGAAKGQLDATTSRLEREIVPNPTVFLDVAGQQPGQLYVGAGVALPLPLWRRNQGELARVHAERRRLEDEHRLLAREVALEVTTALRDLKTRQAEARLWAERVVPSAEANVELVRQGWLAGKFDLFRVVQVTREAAEARRHQLEVLRELWRARINLERATGGVS